MYASTVRLAVSGRHFIFSSLASVLATASTRDARPTKEPRSTAASGRPSPKSRAKAVFERRFAIKSKRPEAGWFAGGKAEGAAVEAWLLLALWGWAADSRTVSAMAPTYFRTHDFVHRRGNVVQSRSGWLLGARHSWEPGPKSSRCVAGYKRLHCRSR